MKVSIRHLVVRVGKRGGKRYFWQPAPLLRAQGWKTVRLPDDEREAVAEAEALNARLDAWRAGQAAPPDAPTKRPTIAMLIDCYQRHRNFQKLPAKTQRDYGRYLRSIAEDWGAFPVAAITPRAIDQLYGQVFARTPSTANHLLAVLRILFRHAMLNGWRADNPASAAHVRGQAVESEGRIWTPDAVEAMARAATEAGRESIALAIALNAWLGQRQGDILALSRPQIDGGVIAITQGKTRAKVRLPVDMVPALADRLRRSIAAAPVTQLYLIVSEETGTRYKADNFRKRFTVIRAAAVAAARRDGLTALAAELAAVDFMHLRHTAVTRLAEAGCSIAEITAITGHSSQSATQIIERYLVRTQTMAAAAFARRIEKERK